MADKILKMKNNVDELKERVKVLENQLASAMRLIRQNCKCQICKTRGDDETERCKFCDDQPLLCSGCREYHFIECKVKTCDNECCIDSDDGWWGGYCPEHKTVRPHFMH